jgi:hypothetical protein
VAFDPVTGVGDAVAGSKREAGGAFLGLACERPVEGGKKSRVVVFGGAGIVDPDAVAAGVNLANRDLLLNALDWLADRKTVEGALEPDDHGARVLVDGELLSFARVVGVYLAPGLLAAIAAAVFFKRRS